MGRIRSHWRRVRAGERTRGDSAVMAFTLIVTFHGVGLFVELPKTETLAVLFCDLDETIAKDGTTFVRFDGRNYKKGTNRRPIDGRPPVPTYEKDDPRRHIVLRR